MYRGRLVLPANPRALRTRREASSLAEQYHKAFNASHGKGILVLDLQRMCAGSQ